MGIVAAVIIVGIVICLVGNILGIFRFGGSKKNDTETEIATETETDTEDKIEMIDLRGLTFEEAQNEIKDKKLDIKLEEGEEISSDLSLIHIS